MAVNPCARLCIPRSLLLLISYFLATSTCLASASVASSTAWVSSRSFLERSRATTKMDWDSQNRIPPWMSNIQPGSSQGVAVVLGQSLRPDGKPPQVLLDRALKAKDLLKEGKVSRIIVTGGDPAGVGTTEAFEMRKVLVSAGIPREVIILESQAETTAENAWYALRWIPRGTGHFYIVTSDFHMPRATYIFQEVFNYFYRSFEEHFKDDPLWKDPVKRYPRLELHQAVAQSFCSGNVSASRDHDPHADIDDFSLRKRVLDELRFLGTKEVPHALYGQPLDNNQIWPVQINVTLDPENEVNFRKALAQIMNTAQALCICVGPPEVSSASIQYPLKLPASSEFPPGLGPNTWQQIQRKCKA